ncbi:MAG: helix-turn-helix domain-containing protein [Oscillospiraceae bacterium]|nr:helix-turn-helix domain-containing protein [Oscillospiraceae bacterium]
MYQWLLPGGITFLLYPAGGYCLGPVLTQPFSREETLRLLEPYDLKSQAKTDILQFYSALPVVEIHTFQRVGALVAGHLSGRDEVLQIEHIQPPAAQPQLQRSPFSPEEDIVRMRQVEARYEHSAALTDAVSQGNLSLALHIISNYDPGTQTTIRNTNPLRNAQNYCIVLNTQLRHALEKTGIHPYQVDRLSNQIGLEIEQLKSTRQLPQFFRQVLARYCRLVQEHTYPKLKPLTHLAVTYIKEHLADNLTVKDTAAVLTVNANYLSATFHRDMGVTFIDFVNRERTRQAAALLKHTSLQIQQIASTVGYNNTSYFAKQFLRFYGVSPSQYRQ